MKKIYIILFLLFVGCTSTQTVHKTEYINKNPRTDAFIVGVGHYKNRIRPLYGVEKDLKNIKKLLRQLNINNIVTLKDSQATLKNIRELFYNYIHSDKNRKGNSFIFYYSGHGIQVLDKNGDEEDNKDEATALYDVTLDNNDLISNGILLDDELHSLLAQIESKKILIFDKCHSGSSHRGDNPFRKSVEGEYELSAKFLKNINSNIKTKRPLKDFVIFSATKDDQEAEDSPLGGLFTNSFIDGVLYRKADINDDKKITIAELEKFCATNISKLAINIPEQYKGIYLKGNFDPYFAPKGARGKTISSIFNIKFSKNIQPLKKEYLLENTLDSLVSTKTIQLSLLGNKTIFKENDIVNFAIRAKKSGYLNIFIAYQDSYKLFMKNQKIRADKQYIFPKDFMRGKYFIAKRPFGKTKIYALLSSKPLSIKDYLSKKENDLDLTNYFRKGVIVVAKKRYGIVNEKDDVDILGIGGAVFEVYY